MTAVMSTESAQCSAVILEDGSIRASHGSYVSFGEHVDIQVIDRLASQRNELAKLLPAVSADLLDEAPVWVYYPWRRAIVRTLGPTSFRRLRLDRNRNKITEAEQAHLLSLTVSVVGLSVGHAIAFALAQEGLCGRLLLADFDELDLSNLNRVPSSLLDTGVAKTVLLGRRLAELDPFLDVELFHDGATADNLPQLVKRASLVVDECDSLDIKFGLRFLAREHHVPLLMHTSDGGILDVERFDLEPDRPVFHGLVDVADAQSLAGLTNAEKIPLIMKILDVGAVSPRMGASLLEMDDQITTWPQLASDVMAGAGVVSAAVRRWGLGQTLPSGRLRLDLDVELLKLATPQAPPAVAEPLLASDTQIGGGSFADRLVGAAVRAPSGGNAQPWRFGVDQQQFEAFVDPERSSLMDIGQRGSFLAAGAALFNAEVVAAAEGRYGKVRIGSGSATDQQKAGEDPVGVLSLGEQIVPELADLAAVVAARCCPRTANVSDPIAPDALATLSDLAKQQGVEARFLQGADKAEVAQIWAEADRIRFLNQELHREMMTELRWPGEDISRGIDVRTLELGDADMSVLSIARRPEVMAELASRDGGVRLGDPSRQLIDAADAFLVLTAPGATDLDFVESGRVLERLWLTATTQSIGMHPLSPVFLYALSPDDLNGVVADHDVDRVWALRAALTDLCGWQASRPLALTLRVTTQPAATIRSLREPPSSRRR